MKRRDFLKSVSGLAAGALAPTAPAIWSPAKADARSETLLIVSEGGPNNLDIHGIGTNVPGYEVSWNLAFLRSLKVTDMSPTFMSSASSGLNLSRS